MMSIGQRLTLAFSFLMMVLLAPLSVAEPAAAAKAVQTTEEPAQSMKTSAAHAHAATVNINTASAEAMAQQLNGIGEAKAQAIVAYRTANGPFASAQDLAKVKGIGAATVEKNAALIVVE